jgi:hypothetical protein
LWAFLFSDAWNAFIGLSSMGTFYYFLFHFVVRYLCDFSYFSSLHISHHKAAFIHVPPLDMPYSASQLADGLRVAINDMIEQVTDKENCVCDGDIVSDKNNSMLDGELVRG